MAENGTIFFNSTRNIYSLTMHIVGFLHFCLWYIGKISPQKSVTYEYQLY